MKNEKPRGRSELPEETFALLYEAAEAENRFRDLGMETSRIREIIDAQLDHELAKLALRGVLVQGALQGAHELSLQTWENQSN